MLNFLRFLIGAILSRFAKRRRYQYADMPTWLLLFFAAASGAYTKFYQSILSDVGPLYLKAFDKVGIMGLGVTGTLLTIALGYCVLNFFISGLLFARTADILKARWFA
ncbi:hypothetical protein J9978_06405 [Chromobacterium violaceum]|uniref:hypothetical protein n=1 Tax=Chromobacterium violaceum TaxID=536 RepID=UPI001B31F9D0|nr:hypothetical protein [Chromobacterium violaceum]MBP4049130.1 hypothetical protein [Chromobacterium violaceum]